MATYMEDMGFFLPMEQDGSEFRATHGWKYVGRGIDRKRDGLSIETIKGVDWANFFICKSDVVNSLPDRQNATRGL